jgi:hypothetical protein
MSGGAVGHPTLTVGTVQVTAVCDVTADFPAPLERAFPTVEAAAWAPWRRRHPGAFSGTDRWRLRDWCFVVRARDRVVLVDTGVGGPGVPGATWIGTPGRLPEELAAAGVEPDEIDLVVLTHLHLDHIGWNLAWDGDRPCPRFPRPATGSSGPTGSCSRPGATRPTGRPSTAAWPPSRPSGWPSCWTATGPGHFPEPFGTVTREDGTRRWQGRR